MQTKERGTAVVVVLLLLLAMGIGMAFWGQAKEPKKEDPNYTKREAELLCNNALYHARRALWFYRSEKEDSWNDILANLEGDSIDPKLHQREYEDKVKFEIDKAWKSLSKIETDRKMTPPRKLVEINKAINALMTVRGLVGNGNKRCSEVVARAFDMDNAIRKTLPEKDRRTKNPRFVLEKIELRNRYRLRNFGQKSSSYFGQILPASGRAVKIVVRDNEDGDDNPLKDRDGQVFVYVTALLPNGILAQTETLVEFNPNSENDSTTVLQSRKLQ